MRLLIMIIVVLTLTNCSKVDRKFDKLYWDPVKGMFRITYGIVKWREHTVKVVDVHLNPMNGPVKNQTIVWIVHDN
jgi:hypothetical protein